MASQRVGLMDFCCEDAKLGRWLAFISNLEPTCASALQIHDQHLWTRMVRKYHLCDFTKQQALRIQGEWNNR